MVYQFYAYTTSTNEGLGGEENKKLFHFTIGQINSTAGYFEKPAGHINGKYILQLFKYHFETMTCKIYHI
jgi:hypothetical protein